MWKRFRPWLARFVFVGGLLVVANVVSQAVPRDVELVFQPRSSGSVVLEELSVDVRSEGETVHGARFRLAPGEDKVRYVVSLAPGAYTVLAHSRWSDGSGTDLQRQDDIDLDAAAIKRARITLAPDEVMRRQVELR